jgi:hypothetical protein
MTKNFHAKYFLNQARIEKILSEKKNARKAARGVRYFASLRDCNFTPRIYLLISRRVNLSLSEENIHSRKATKPQRLRNFTSWRLGAIKNFTQVILVFNYLCIHFILMVIRTEPFQALLQIY